MPKNRGRKDEELDEELDDEEPEEDEELDDDEVDEADDDVDENDEDDDDLDDDDEEEEEEEEEEEPEPKPRRRRSASSKRSNKKQAERRKVDDDDDEPPRRKTRRSSERKRSDRRRPSDRRRRRRDEDEEPRRRRRPAASSKTKRRSKSRKDRKEADLNVEIVEPKSPPEADIDLAAELDPSWEPGVMLGGGLALAGVAFAVVALMTSGGLVSTISVIGLVILLMAIASGGIGVLARKSWGYILGIGAGGLGIVAGLIWALSAVVSTEMSPLWPLFFFLCNLGSTIFLFHMRWGPGLMADERDRLRSLKKRTAHHTTVSGELALSGSIAAVLASVLCGLLLMGTASGSSRPSGAAAQFTEGMDLETITEAPETGAVVLARWGNEDYFFLGRVEQSRGGDEFHVVYLDGDRAWVRMQDLRRDTVRAGASVHIHVQGHDGWLPAVITQRSGNRVEADVGSQRVWVPLGMVRVRESN